MCEVEIWADKPTKHISHPQPQRSTSMDIVTIPASADGSTRQADHCSLLQQRHFKLQLARTAMSRKIPQLNISVESSRHRGHLQWDGRSQLLTLTLTLDCSRQHCFHPILRFTVSEQCHYHCRASPYRSQVHSTAGRWPSTLDSYGN